MLRRWARRCRRCRGSRGETRAANRACRRDPVRRLRHQLGHDETVIDFAKAVQLIEGLPAGDERRDLIEDLARRWTRADPHAAIAWIEELTGVERRHAMESALESWADVDPLAALEYVAAMPNSEFTLDWVYHSARMYSDRDRGAALAWALEHADANVRERALSGALEHWAEADPAAAAEFVLTIGGRTERLSALEQVARRWAERDRDAALAWAAGLTGEDRARATREILHRLVEENPRRAAEVYEGIAQDLPGGEHERGPAWHIGRELASHWAHYAPGEAAAWALTLPERGDLRRDAVREVTERWVRSDSIAASAWVDGLEGGQVRDSAAAIISEYSMHRGDFQSALDWANSIGDAERQQEWIERIHRHWRRHDPASAPGALPRPTEDAGSQ